MKRPKRPIRIQIIGDVDDFTGTQVVRFTIWLRDGSRVMVRYMFPPYPVDALPNLAPFPKQGLRRAWRHVRRHYRKHARKGAPACDAPGCLIPAAREPRQSARVAR